MSGLVAEGISGLELRESHPGCVEYHGGREAKHWRRNHPPMEMLATTVSLSKA